MTNEALKQGFEIKNRIDEINRVINDIKPYFHCDIEIDIQKLTRGYYGDKLHYRLSSDSPLYLAIGSALEDMKAELQQELDNLDCNSKEEPFEPMRKTRAWWKVWK